MSMLSTAITLLRQRSWSLGRLSAWTCSTREHLKRKLSEQAEGQERHALRGCSTQAQHRYTLQFRSLRCIKAASTQCWGAPVMKVSRGSRGCPCAARCCTKDSTHSTAARASSPDRPCRSTTCWPSFSPRHSATCASDHSSHRHLLQQSMWKGCQPMSLHAVSRVCPSHCIPWQHSLHQMTRPIVPWKAFVRSRCAKVRLQGWYLLSSDGPVAAHGSLHCSRDHLAPLRVVGLEPTAAGTEGITP